MAGVNGAYTVIIADDHALLREELRADLEEHGFAVVAEAEDALGAVCAALKERPQSVLLDVRWRATACRPRRRSSSGCRTRAS